MDFIYFKLIHLVAVVLYLGNIITRLFWMRFSVKIKDLKINSFTMMTIIKLDRYFTIPGVILITAFGILAAVFGHFPLLRTGWILWSIILFTVSGILFETKVAPLQNKIYNLTLNKENSSNFDWMNFNKLYVVWHLWALIATLAPLVAFAMKTLKIPNKSRCFDLITPAFKIKTDSWFCLPDRHYRPIKVLHQDIFGIM